MTITDLFKSTAHKLYSATKGLTGEKIVEEFFDNLEKNYDHGLFPYQSKTHDPKYHKPNQT